jgi:hypothetical protein
MKNNIIRLGIAVAFSGLFAASGCEKTGSQDPGFLEGVISIGPLCPVEQVPPQPPCLPTAETYKAWPVGIWTIDGGKLVALILPNLDGSYKTELYPGTYLVKLVNHQSIGSNNLPALVTITAFNNTNLNINIDTGIR